MSYLLFHIFFILPPILLLARKGPLLATVGRRAGLGLLLMALVTLAYTTPWDNYLVYQGVWDYEEDRVVGTIGYVPLEEYLFFVLLQPLLAGLWLYWLLGREGEPLTLAWEARRPKVRLLGTLFWLAAILPFGRRPTRPGRGSDDRRDATRRTVGAPSVAPTRPLPSRTRSSFPG